jgi:hypothetical protein
MDKVTTSFLEQPSAAKNSMNKYEWTRMVILHGELVYTYEFCIHEKNKSGICLTLCVDLEHVEFLQMIYPRPS